MSVKSTGSLSKFRNRMNHRIENSFLKECFYPIMIFCPSISTTSPKLTLAPGLVSVIPFTETIPQIIKSFASLFVKKRSLFLSNFQSLILLLNSRSKVSMDYILNITRPYKYWPLFLAICFSSPSKQPCKKIFCQHPSTASKPNSFLQVQIQPEYCCNK